MKRKELSHQFVAAFCVEMAMLLSAGMTPSDAVFQLLVDEPDTDGRVILNALCAPLLSGAPLSAALSVSDAFPAYVVCMTEIGEKTGCLTDTLRMLSEYYQRQERLSKAVRHAVAYPSALFIMMTAVVIVLVAKVLPIFSDAYARLGTALPPLAARLFNMGGWLERFAQAAAVITGMMVVLLIAARLSPPVKNVFVGLFNRVAGNSGTFLQLAVARYMSVLALAVTSGMNLNDAADMAEAAASGHISVRRYKNATSLLREGVSPADALHRAGILSARDKRKLSVGAVSGRMDAALAEIAAQCERDACDALDHAVGLIEPALVIGASVMVGIVILTLLLPMMAVMTAIG